MEEDSFTKVFKNQYKQNEKNPYKRPFFRKPKKYKIGNKNYYDNENNINQNIINDSDSGDGRNKNNNYDEDYGKNYSILQNMKRQDKLNVFKDNFLNINYKKSSKSNKKEYKYNKIIYNNNYIINNNNGNYDNYYKPKNKSNYQLAIDQLNIVHKEVATGYADYIPESISDKLYNSIVRIVLYQVEATGFFMKFKLNNKEMKCLFTCFNVISDNDINNEITIDIYFGKKGKEYHRTIELENNMRFMKAYEKEDVTLIEIIDKDRISESKYLTPDFDYEHCYQNYLYKNFYLAGYPQNHFERCISSGIIIGINNYHFYYELDTRDGSSGSPIVNNKLDVIGVCNSGGKNSGTFICEILGDLKESFVNKKKYSIIKEQKIIGSLDSIPKKKYEKIKEQLDKAVCQIQIKKIIIGTGFICKIPFPDELNYLPVLMTNNHVINEKDYKENKEIQIIFDDGKINKKFITYPERKFYTSENYDTTIIEIFPKKDDLHYFLEISQDDEKSIEGINAYVLHYPNENESKISLGFLKDLSDNDYTSNSDKKKYNIPKINEFDFGHTCGTEGGSSGSPILLLNNLKIIGIHKGFYPDEKRINLGTFLKYPISKFKETKNEITIKLKINKEDLNKYVYFLNDPLDDFGEWDHFHGIEELNKKNAIIYINNEKVEYEKGRKFDKIGIYEIKIIININITKAKYMFHNCNNIIEINLSKFNAENITDMEGMFRGCCNLESLDLSSFDTKNVTNMKQMFTSCRNLESLDLSSFNTKKVINMTEMFCDCVKLKSIVLSSFDTKNVTSMAGMFMFCDNLKTLDLSSFDTKNVTNMGAMFYECCNLESIYLSSSFKTKKVTEMTSMFIFCKNLKNINLTLFNTKNVTDMKGMFHDCEHLKNIIDYSKFDKNTIFEKHTFC